MTGPGENSRTSSDDTTRHEITEAEALFKAAELRPPPIGPLPQPVLARENLHAERGAEPAERLAVRLRRICRELSTTPRRREEAEVEQRLVRRPRITRTNLIASVSPKGGVGKTTCAFLIADLLASRPKLRVLAIDTNPDFGTLGKLAPDSHRSRHQLTDVINQMDRVRSAAELDPFVASTPSGAHLLSAPQHPEVMEAMSPEMYGQLLTFLGRFYHVIVLDLGTGLTDPLARFALERADQAVVVTHAAWVTLSTVIEALDYVLKRLDGERVTMVVNKATRRELDAALAALDAELPRHGIGRRVAIPEDPWLRAMLDDGTYSCEKLPLATRTAVKRLAVAVAEELV